MEQSNISKEKKGLFPWFNKRKKIKISDYLNVNLISFLEANSRNEAIAILVNNLERFEVIEDKNNFHRAILERERIVSTGIGMGVAIPHAKLSFLDSFFLVVGIQKEKGIEWNAIDKAPIRLIFMIGGPNDKQKEYLQILSHLTRIIKNEDLRKKIIISTTKEQVMKLLAPF